MKTKGQTESYSFLIGILIMLLILGSISVGVYKYTTTLANVKDCYEDLTNATTELEPGGTMNIFCDMKMAKTFFHSKVIIGFDAFENQVGKDIIYNRPSTCVPGKACLCYCQYQGVSDTVLSKIKLDTEVDCKESTTKCTSFDDFELIQGLNTQAPEGEEFNLNYYDDLIIDKNGFWNVYFIKSDTGVEAYPGTMDEYAQTEFIRFSIEEQNVIYSGTSCLSAQEIEDMLIEYNSPMQGLGSKMLEFQDTYNVKVETAIAFFLSETSFGQLRPSTHNPGNVKYYDGCDGKFTTETNEGEKTFCVYGNPTEDNIEHWEKGVEDWFKVISGYVREGYTTIEDISPHYFDTQDPDTRSELIGNELFNFEC
ncbi:MAG: hypothetical protein ABIF40_00010 [archaeon]